MACVTLKRPIDVLGSPREAQPLAKRKRCGPPLFAATPSPASSRAVKRAKRKLDVDEAYSPNSGPGSPVHSPFIGAVSPVEPGTPGLLPWRGRGGGGEGSVRERGCGCAGVARENG